jgi:hypothetical protein
MDTCGAITIAELKTGDTGAVITFQEGKRCGPARPPFSASGRKLHQV